MFLKEYPIQIDQEKDRTYIEIPINAMPISATFHDEKAGYSGVIYCIIDEQEKESCQKEVIWLGTECPISEEQFEKITYYKFLGSFKLKDYLIWHIWIEPTYYPF